LVISLVCRPFQVAPIRGSALSLPVHDHDKLAKGIAKKSGRGTRRPRATGFSYNQSGAERKFNFAAGRNAAHPGARKPERTQRGAFALAGGNGLDLR